MKTHHLRDKKEAVKKSYINDCLSIDSACQLHGVSRAVAYRWKADDKIDGIDWEKLRTARNISGKSIESIARSVLAEFMRQYKATMEHLKESDLPAQTRVQLLASLSHSLVETVSSTKRIMPATNRLAVALEVIEKQMDFVKKNHPQHLAAMVEVLEPFGKYIEERFK